MVSVSETVRVEVPIEEAFAFLDDPENHAEVTPSLAEVRNIEPLENGGKRVEHTYRMAGIGLDGALVETTHEEGELMVFEMDGDLEGEIRISFEPVEEGTEITYAASYELPGRVLSAVADPFVRRYNERELRTTLENVKDRLELADAAGS